MRFLIILFLCYLGYQFLKGLLGAKSETPREQPKVRPHATGGEDLVEDPYCHTYVPISDACKVTMDGKPLYFCCKKCQEGFLAGRTKDS
jgi:YHS domain-containing protein